MSRIPRHYHFVYGLRPQTEPFHLVHYLCLESCLRVNRPERVTLHLHHLPHGRYWDLIKDQIEISPVEPVELVSKQHYDIPLIGHQLRYAHHSDFIRLAQLLKHGGIYADIDTLFINAPEPSLFEKSCVLGREDPVLNPATGRLETSLCNAMIFAEPGAPFVRRWLEEMPAAFDGSWSNHSCQLAARLHARHPEEVHVEPARTFYPYMWTPEQLRRLFEEDHSDWRGACSVHLWAHLWWDRRRTDFSRFHAGLLTERFIRGTDTTYTRAARHFLPPRRGLSAMLAAAGRGLGRNRAGPVG